MHLPVPLEACFCFPPAGSSDDDDITLDYYAVLDCEQHSLPVTNLSP